MLDLEKRDINKDKIKSTRTRIKIALKKLIDEGKVEKVRKKIFLAIF